jgi:hypothetical protein
MKIAIITRFCYPEKLTKKRLDLFQNNLIESLSNQTYKDFDLFIITDNLYGAIAHPENLELIKGLDFKGMNVIFEDRPQFKYDVEVRIDSDDTIISTFVQFLYNIASETETLLINFKPIKVINGVKYFHERDYSNQCASMFIALIQMKNKTKGVYDRPHCEMANYIGNVLTVNEGYVFLNIHDSNMTSKMTGREVKYGTT